MSRARYRWNPGLSTSVTCEGCGQSWAFSSLDETVDVGPCPACSVALPPRSRGFMELLGAEWTDAEKRAATPTEGIVYGGLGVATDGTAIDSRTKHREYLKRNGLALTSDYAQHFEKAKEARAKAFSGESDTKERRETVARALYQQTRGRK